MVVPHQPTWLQRAAARLVFLVEHCLISTLRWQIHDQTGCFTGPEARPVIFCIWHNRLALAMAIYRKHPRRLQPKRRMAAMVSASKDGALLARILENFEVQPVRGSSSRRGAQALRELSSWAQRGLDLAITPDGPRGPRYVVQEGVVALAQLTGLPVIPARVRVGWKITLRSWDRFQIPLPFSRCELVFCDPVRISRDATPAEREALRSTIEREMQDPPSD